MKVNLLYPDKEIEIPEKLSQVEDSISFYIKDLFKDLEIEIILSAISLNDQFLYKNCKYIFSHFETDSRIIKYRQEIIKDVIKNETLFRKLYSIISNSIEDEKKAFYYTFSKLPGAILFTSFGIISVFLKAMKQIFKISNELGKNIKSEGMIKFCTMVKENLNISYLNEMETILKKLQFKKGVSISAQLGFGNTGINYVLLDPV